jgi:glutaryl-CoA dehydrogenase
MPLPASDYLLIDSQLTESERMVRAMTRRFVDERLRPLLRDCWRDERFPLDVVPEMASLGLLGPEMQGANAVECGLVMQELERGDSGLQSFATAQTALALYPIARYGSEEQKARWLPLLLEGKAIGCLGLTEPDFGSNPAAMRTRAERTAQGWKIADEKTWITNGSAGDVAIVWARTDEGIRGFLVERGNFRVTDIHDKLSMRVSITSSLVFDGSDAQELPGARWLKAVLACLAEARYCIAWGSIGAALDCYETAREYALARRQFDNRPIASHQLVQEKLATMISEISQAQLLALHCARLKDAGKLELAHVSMLKRNNATMALNCARTARDLLGANGIMSEYRVMRHLCNLEP